MEILNNVEVSSKLASNNNLEHWKSNFPAVFSSKVGKLKDFQLKLHIDKSVKPIQVKPRNKPFHLRKAIDEQIKLKLSQEIIEEVIGEPTDWLSETVIIPKHDSKEIRLCTDMKAANSAIKRERYQMPNIEDIIYKSNGMEIYSKIDLRSAFEQIELDPECRYISRFRTHNGIYQHKRLFFGINSAPEIFHNFLSRLLNGIEGVQNAVDDILVMGKDGKENYDRVEQVLKRLEIHGLTANEDKCRFNLPEVTFFGLKLSANGVSLSDQNIQAIKEFNTQ